MFKKAVLRQSRLCRVPRTVAVSALSARASLQTTPIYTRLAAPLSLRTLAFARRAYSSEAAATVETPADAEGAPASVTSFSDLTRLGVHENIVRAITQDMGYETMTDVQALTMSPALEGKDIVAQAKTGTGKTLAFLIPVLQKILQDDPSLEQASRGRRRGRADDVRSIIISPTRELAEQIGHEAEKLCRRTGIRVQIAVGGTQRRMMLSKTRQEGCHLLVATPGRLNDILSDEGSGIAAPNLTSLVLDEADRMLEVGFEQELRNITSLLPDPATSPRQTLLFSATLPKNVVQLARTYVNPHNFKFVQTIKANEVLTHERVPQHIVTVKGYENHLPTLVELIERALNGEHGPEPFKAIVYFKYTAMVELVAQAFQHIRAQNRSMPRVYDIHSKKSQRQRTQAADLFRTANSAILLSSDVTARGMDFPNVTHVIQIGLPPSREQYIHRIGRTGRAGKAGQGWLIISDHEIAEARDMLPGLPIKRNEDLECAVVDLEANPADPPAQYDLTSAAMQRVDEEVLTSAYMAHFGQNISRDLGVRLRRWVRHGWGREEPPAISHSIAQKRGILRMEGLNIADRSSRQSFGGSRGGSRSLFGDDRRGDAGDDFEAAFKDGSGSRGGFRSGGGSRSGGGFRSESGFRSGGSSRSGGGFRSGAGFRSRDKFGSRDARDGNRDRPRSRPSSSF